MNPDLHIWIIDDDNSIRWVLEKAFQQDGSTTSSFENADSAVEQLKDLQPDAIITDVRMPGMDGIEISKKAADFLKNSWWGECFMAVGINDPVLGLPVMEKLHAGIRGASELMVIEKGGHFVQEWGKPIAQAALDYFTD